MDLNTRQDFINAIRDELDLDVNDWMDTDIYDILDLAVSVYSSDVPYRVTETFTNVLGQTVLTLSNPIYSSYVKVYTEQDGYKKFLNPWDYEFNTVIGILSFFKPLEYDTVYVEYDTNHVLDDTSTTIPEKHKLAVLWLACHFVGEKELYGNEFLSMISDGIFRVEFDTRVNMSGKSTYLQKYMRLVQSNAGAVSSDLMKADYKLTSSRNILDINEGEW